MNTDHRHQSARQADTTADGTTFNVRACACGERQAKNGERRFATWGRHDPVLSLHILTRQTLRFYGLA